MYLDDIVAQLNTFYEIYFPEVFGRSDGGVFEIVE